MLMLLRLLVTAFDVFALGTAIYSTSLNVFYSVSVKYTANPPIVSIYYTKKIVLSRLFLTKN